MIFIVILIIVFISKPNESPKGPQTLTIPYIQFNSFNHTRVSLSNPSNHVIIKFTGIGWEGDAMYIKFDNFVEQDIEEVQVQGEITDFSIIGSTPNIYFYMRPLPDEGIEYQIKFTKEISYLIFSSD